MNSRDYWKDREEEALKHYITDEKEYDRQIEQIYKDMLDSVQEQIDGFYGRYAGAEGITIAEAKKRVSQADIAAYERKAKRYVKDRDFSKQANEEMRLYNATMKINRLEMLKANIGLELIKGHDELEKFMGEILKGRTVEELERQAGILGKTVRNNATKAHAIVNGSFHNGTFSDRIWQYQDLMREDLGKLLQTGLIQGKNPRAIAKDLKKYWFGNDPRTGGGAKYCMERLMRTELARVQTEAQKQSFVRNGFGKYMFIVNSGCCDICQATAKKNDGIYDIEKMMPGENAPPMHPNCRCSTAAYEDDDEYEAWLDYLDKGGTTAEWNKTGKKEWENLKNASANSKNGDIIKTENHLATGGKSTLAEPAFSSDKPYEIKLSREKKKEIIARGISEPQPIFAVDTPTNKFASNVRKVPPEKGFYDVALHGRDTSVDFFDTPIDAYTLAQIIMQRTDYVKGTPVRLLSCNVGNTTNTGNCFAQLVANELDVLVKAPTDILYVEDDGSFSIGKHDDGYLKPFYSRKVDDE